MALGRDDSLRSHWRPSTEWTSGDYVTWHLLPAADGQVAQAAAPVTRALSRVAQLDVVQPRWLHLTLQGVAARADLSTAAVDDVLAGVRAAVADVPAPVTTFGAPVVHREGVLLEGGPAGPVAAVRAAVRRGLREVLGHAPGRDDEPVWPHVSLAYCSAELPAAAVLDALADGPGPHDVVETFALVSLIALRREERRYVWDPLGTAPLA